VILGALLSLYLHHTSLKGFTSGIVRIDFAETLSVLLCGDMLRWNMSSSFLRFSLFTVALGSVMAVPFSPFCLTTLFTSLVRKSDPNNSIVRLDLII
jgi:hypothetical protein